MCPLQKTRMRTTHTRRFCLLALVAVSALAATAIRRRQRLASDGASFRGGWPLAASDSDADGRAAHGLLDDGNGDGEEQSYRAFGES